MPQPTVPSHVPKDNYAIIKLTLKEVTKKKFLTFQTPLFVQTYSPKLYKILVALHSTFQSLYKLALHVHLCLRIKARVDLFLENFPTLTAT